MYLKEGPKDTPEPRFKMVFVQVDTINFQKQDKLRLKVDSEFI